MRRIKFTLPDINGGLTEVKGIVGLEESYIVIDIESSFLGEFSQSVKTVKVEAAALDDAELKRGVFVDKICLVPKKRDLLDAIPGSHLGEVKLKVWRKYRAESEKLVDQILEIMDAARRAG